MAQSPAKKTTKPTTGAKRPSHGNNKTKSGPSGRPAGLFTWLVVGMVVVVIITILGIKIFSGSTKTNVGNGQWQATSQTIVNELTTVPASTFNAVGVNSSVVAVTNLPNRTSGQKLLQWPDSHGVKRPTVFYLGSEYCPYCAAERWSTIIALSRFGTWSNIGDTTSAPAPEVFPSTPSFTFFKAVFSSKYLNFVGVENLSNVPDPTTGYTILQRPTSQQSAILSKYDNGSFIPGGSSGAIPFISYGNKFLGSGSLFSPSAFTHTTRAAAAAVLSDPNNALAQAIIAAANYQTAVICSLTHQAPSNVCTSVGVVAAKTQLHIK